MAKSKRAQVRIIKEQQPIEKADTSVQLTQEEAFNAGDWIMPPNDMIGLRTLVKHSTILPQCIRAYKNNIAGFGIGVRYIEDAEETPEMAEEFARAEEIIELLNIEQDTKEVFEDIVEARETYGIAYLEVVRDLAGEVVQIDFIKDTPSVRKTKPLEPYIPTVYYHHGQQVERKKRYCKYKQEIGGKVVYFKEFGDPRIMDRRDGKYLAAGETLELDYQANEVLEFAIGTEPYGEVRWIGQVLGVDGSRKAESLNNNYFENGRHTPLMIMIKGGTLTDESFEKLQQYMNDIKGAAGQHAFIILETESSDGRVDFDQSDKPEIEVKDLAAGETLELDYQANEVLEFAIGTEPYGEVRWIGQVLGVDGSRKAESLNNNYFENGRHTPLMIMIKGGTLTDESFEKLQQYMNDIKGAAGQHAFIILETESSDGRVDFDQSDKPEIEVKDLANILQKDELFQNYLDNNRRKVQSSFQLPDLYVGYTTDFNRATAQTAQEVTEEQVFQPERKSLAWAINNRLLNGYQFRYVEAYFLEPDISNPDDLYKILTVCNNAGGLTPNMAKRRIYEAFGETAEDYPDNPDEAAWGDIPLAYNKNQGSSFDLGQLTMSLQKQIAKAAENHDDAVVAVMKEVKRLLVKMDKGEE